MARVRVLVTVEDVGGSFRRMVREATPMVRRELEQAVNGTARGVEDLMNARVPVGPDAPHIKDAIERHDASARSRAKSLRAEVGYFGGTGDDADQPHVALYNEFRPNNQPFMRDSADDMSNIFLRNVREALLRLEAGLSQ